MIEEDQISKVAKELSELPEFRLNADWIFDSLEHQVAFIVKQKFPHFSNDAVLESAHAIAGLKPMTPVQELPQLPTKIAAILRCRHTACPVGYREWHAWAEKMEKTHVQAKCPKCGLYAIWEPKAK